jgi:hypothetical protein
MDAVKQWEFTPTLLNGVPVPVIMTVTVQFTLQSAARSSGVHGIVNIQGGGWDDG